MGILKSFDLQGTSDCDRNNTWICFTDAQKAASIVVVLGGTGKLPSHIHLPPPTLPGLESARQQYKQATSSLSGPSGCFLETYSPLITPTPWGSTWHFQQETARHGSSCFIWFFYLSWKRLQLHLVNTLPVGRAYGTISHPRSPAEAAVCKSLHVHPAGAQVTPAEGCGRLEKQDSGGLCRACVFSLLRGMLFAFRSLETKGARALPKGFFIPLLQKFHSQGEKRMCCFDFFFSFLQTLTEYCYSLTIWEGILALC